MNGRETALTASVLVLILPLMSWQMAAETDAPLDHAGATPTESEFITMSVEAVEPTSPFRMPPPEHFAVIVERPLFQPSRRPPAEPLAAAPAPRQPEPLTATLRGIVSNGGQRTALLWVQGHTKLLRLSGGEVHQGWRVEAIEEDRIVLRRGDDRAELRLPYGHDR